MQDPQDAHLYAVGEKRLMDNPTPSAGSIVLTSIVVFVIAVILRVPSCYESFWLDELHSAWCVWGSFRDLFPRADIGHQPPFYFVGLWFWKQVVGESEVALRLSSVLAVSASCVVLTAGVASWTKSLAAGVAAGMVLATESNALFFGTELRPFAFVIFFTSVALVCFVRLSTIDSRHEHRRCWALLIAAILFAALVQPTAVGVLSFLPLALGFIWLVRDRRQLVRFTLLDGFLGLTAAATLFALWHTTLSESWHQRSSWESFASASRVVQIWETWDWTWLLLVPVAITLVTVIAWIFQAQRPSIHEVLAPMAVLVIAAVSATSLYWIVSRVDWVPVWHRRYFIAVLPMLACVVGGAVGIVETIWRPAWKGRTAATLAASALVFFPAHQQGMLARLTRYPVALVTRGEDWRAAIRWVRAVAEANDRIYLDAGLIESRAWLSNERMAVRQAPTTIAIRALPTVQPTTRQLEYLVYPVRGPYPIARDVMPIHQSVQPDWLNVTTNKGDLGRTLTIRRQPADQVDVLLGTNRPHVMGFGNVSVIVRPSRLDHRY